MGESSASLETKFKWRTELIPYKTHLSENQIIEAEAIFSFLKILGNMEHFLVPSHLSTQRNISEKLQRLQEKSSHETWYYNLMIKSTREINYLAPGLVWASTCSLYCYQQQHTQVPRRGKIFKTIIILYSKQPVFAQPPFICTFWWQVP